ncbi:MAG: tRNA (cytidine(34)-2'-O)-methyltransferase [Alphaproteobacteria bacterium]
MIQLALYQPDIPQNTGAILRFAACLGLHTHVIGPTGFDLSDRALKRSGLDYVDPAAITRHSVWADFTAWCGDEDRRTALATTQAACSYTTFEFSKRDVLLFGRESAGVPVMVHEAASARLLVPMMTGRRSLRQAHQRVRGP